MFTSHDKWIKRCYYSTFTFAAIMLVGMILFFVFSPTAPNPLFTLTGYLIIIPAILVLISITLSGVIAIFYRFKTHDKRYDKHIIFAIAILIFYLYRAYFK